MQKLENYASVFGFGGYWLGIANLTSHLLVFGFRFREFPQTSFRCFMWFLVFGLWRLHSRQDGGRGRNRCGTGAAADVGLWPGPKPGRPRRRERGWAGSASGTEPGNSHPVVFGFRFENLAEH